jgi:hypothetical protein
MSTANGKLLEFFVRIPKLETDGSNWVIFKDRFVFAAAAADLEKHIDGTGTAPIPPAFTLGGPTSLTADQTAEIKLYEENQSKWMMNEAVIKHSLGHSTLLTSQFGNPVSRVWSLSSTFLGLMHFAHSRFSHNRDASSVPSGPFIYLLVMVLAYSDIHIILFWLQLDSVFTKNTLFFGLSADLLSIFWSSKSECCRIVDRQTG